MFKRKIIGKKLLLSKETLRTLSENELGGVNGAEEPDTTKKFTEDPHRQCTGQSCKSCNQNELC